MGIKEGEVQVSQINVGKEAVQWKAQIYLNTTSEKANLKLTATAELGHIFFYLTCCLSPNRSYKTKKEKYILKNWDVFLNINHTTL